MRENIQSRLLSLLTKRQGEFGETGFNDEVAILDGTRCYNNLCALGLKISIGFIQAYISDATDSLLVS